LDISQPCVYENAFLCLCIIYKDNTQHSTLPTQSITVLTVRRSDIWRTVVPNQANQKPIAELSSYTATTKWS